MRCFRLTHAGLVIELEEGEARSSLFIDPGMFSDADEIARAIDSAAPVAAVVITHEHPDHWNTENITAIRAASPNAPIFTTQATASALADAGISTDVQVVCEGDRMSVGPFVLDFYGRYHEVLHSSIPVIENIGVQVNGTLAWGGDCLTRPPFVAEVLGVPIGSPWSNIAQVMDFVLTAAPGRVFLTHDAMLSARGHGAFTTRVQWCLEQFGGELLTIPHLDEDLAARLDLGEPAITHP